MSMIRTGIKKAGARPAFFYREEGLLLHGILGGIGSSASGGTGSADCVFGSTSGVFGGAGSVFGSVDGFAGGIFGGVSRLGSVSSGRSGIGLGRFSRGRSRGGGRSRGSGRSRRRSGGFFFFAASSDSNSDQRSDQERLVHGSILLMEYKWGPEWN